MNDLITFNKPCGVICQFSGHEKYPCLRGYVDRPGFYPAGRLNTDSEGLLSLTDSSVPQTQVVDLKFKREKAYWTQVEGSPDKRRLGLLCNGMDLDGLVIRPAKAGLLGVREADIL